MRAIYKRELKAYFNSVIGWLFCAASLFFLSLYFVSYNLMSGYPYIAYALSSATFIFLISIPILTMRILAEERKQKIDQLILTAPVSVGKIVLGKYLAMATVFMVSVVIVCFYPLIMKAFGDISLLESYVSILGYTLYGLAGIAIGLFISAITESQVIAAVLTFLSLFVTYMMSGITGMISSTGNILTKILNCLDFRTRAFDFYDGALSVTGTAYFISAIGLFLFFTVQAIQKRRFTISTKKLKAGVYSSSMIVIVTVAAVFFNLMVNELPESIKAIDITSNKMYSITEDTTKFLEGLSEDVTIYVLASEGNYDTGVQKTLSKYEESSKHIKIEYKDPSVYPTFASQYTDATVSSGSLIIAGSKRTKVVDYSDLYETETDYTTYTETPTGYDAEGQITSALAYITSESNTKIYAISGHGEAEISEAFQSMLTKANIEIETLSLLTAESIPEDAQAVLIMSPQSDFSSDETKKVQDYLKKGGNALITVSWREQKLENLNTVLKEYGITVGNEMIAETNTSYYLQEPFYLLPNIASTDITSSIYQKYYVFCPYAVNLTIDSSDESNSITQILTSSDSSYAKANFQNAQTYEKEEGDIAGPCNVGVSSERTIDDETTSKIVIYSSDDIFTDNADDVVSGANKKLFQGSINSIVSTDASVSIPVKAIDNTTITVPQFQVILIGVITVLVIPVVLLITGIVVAVRRRKK
ncbi:MAG: Gldg family protein [Lachnospiraceae bacterium]|nr:Gldg family protein [Lachnospiraceae bacterium]